MGPLHCSFTTVLKYNSFIHVNIQNPFHHYEKTTKPAANNHVPNEGQEK